MTELEQREKFLIEKLNFYTRRYDEGNPYISDKEWDNMYFELQNIEKQLGRSLPNSPTQKIHYEIVNSLEKVVHNHQMLSLAKTKDWNEFLNYFDSKKDVVGMLKMDGLTLSLRYLDGKLVSAETRGDGYIGENVLHNAKVIPSIPKEIKYREELIVDGEIICKYDDFKEFENEYANPRNFASGSIRLLDSKECEKRNLTFIAWNVVKGLSNSLSDNLLKLRHLGFKDVPNTSNFDSDAQEWLQNKAKELGYPIDGLVGRYDDRKYGESLGATGHHSKSAYAFKFYDDEYQSELKEIEWTMGRFGELTPVAIFEPIDFGDSIVTRASLHNLSVMNETLHIPYVGQPIKVVKQNQIIPQIVWADKISEGGDIDYPEMCPICGKPISIHVSDTGVETVWCDNPDCEGKIINKLEHFCGKNGLDIKGLSKKTLGKLIDWEWIKDFEDIFELEKYREEWIKKEGFGKKSVDNILKSIQDACDTNLEKFISAIGIPLIGKENAKVIAEKAKTWSKFRELINNKFSFENWDTFGPEKSQSILNFNYSQADIIEDKYLSFKENEEKSENNLNGLTFVITGSLNQYSNREELKSIIEARGGKVVGSVSKNTTNLINNDINSTSSKNQKAKALNVPIITESEFISKYLK